jgi:hypothetical protein
MFLHIANEPFYQVKGICTLGPEFIEGKVLLEYSRPCPNAVGWVQVI